MGSRAAGSASASGRRTTVYVTDPRTTATDDLLIDLYVPLADA
jgi:hypothetical protein